MLEFLPVVAIVGSIFLILVCSQYVLTELCGQISVIIIPYCLTGCMLYTYLVSKQILWIHGLSMEALPALLLTVLATSIFAGLFGAITSQFRGELSLIISLLAYFFFIGVISQFTTLQSLLIGVNDDETLQFGGFHFTNIKLSGYEFNRIESMAIISIIFLLLVLIYTHNVSRSALARKMRAVGENETIAGMSSVHSIFTIVQTHIFCGAVASLAGILVAYMIRLLDVMTIELWMSFSFVSLIQLIVLILISYLKKFSTTVIVSLLCVCISMIAVYYIGDVIDLRFNTENRIIVSSSLMIAFSIVAISRLYLIAHSSKKAL